MPHTLPVIDYSAQRPRFRVHWLVWLLIANVVLCGAWCAGAYFFFFDKLPRTWPGSTIESVLEILRLTFLSLSDITIAAATAWAIVRFVRWIRAAG